MEFINNPNLYCPITGDLMIDPVVDAEGNTYERSAIESWIDTKGTSPITRNKATRDDLRPNRSLKSAIADIIASGADIPRRIDRQVGTKSPGPPPQLSLTITAKKSSADFVEKSGNLGDLL